MVSSKPKGEQYCVFDVEGSAAENDFQGCAVVSDNSRKFHLTMEDAIADMGAHALAGFTLVAHNAEYDIMSLLWPAGADIRLEYYSHKLSAGLWRVLPGQPLAKIIDSLGLAAGLSVANLGKAMNLPKLPTPQRLLGKDPNRYEWKCERHGTWECVECYCLRDAEIVLMYVNSLRDYLAQYRLPVRRKLGGVAVRLWDSLDNHGRVQLRSKRIEDMCRTAYHGGRVEAFKYGKVNNVHVYDVKSMYPSVMVTAPMPGMEKLRMYEPEPDSTWHLQYEGVSECEVDVPPCYVPVLPVMYGERLYFPVGHIKGCFTHVELRAAIERGAKITRMYRTVWSPDNVYPFTNYIGVLAAQRDHYKKQKDPRQQVVKILMNALYGRLGLTREQEMDTVRPLAKDEHAWQHEGEKVEVIGGRLSLRKTIRVNRPSPHANVLWASQITAYARVRLHSLLEQAGVSLLYCDTDGVYTDAPIFQESHELGGVELRGVYQEGTFYGPKLYRLESTDGNKMIRAKGVPRHMAETYLQSGSVEYRQPGRVLQAYTQKVDPAVWVVVHKEQQLVPAKRHLLDPYSYKSGAGCSDTVPIAFADAEPETAPELL